LPAWAVSPKPKADTVITSADYLDSEEAINEWIARLKADEGISHGGPSVIIYDHIPSPLLLITPVLDIILKTKAN